MVKAGRDLDGLQIDDRLFISFWQSHKPFILTLLIPILLFNIIIFEHVLCGKACAHVSAPSALCVNFGLVLRLTLISPKLFSLVHLKAVRELLAQKGVIRRGTRAEGLLFEVLSSRVSGLLLLSIALFTFLDLFLFLFIELLLHLEQMAVVFVVEGIIVIIWGWVIWIELEINFKWLCGVFGRVVPELSVGITSESVHVIFNRESQGVVAPTCYVLYLIFSHVSLREGFILHLISNEFDLLGLKLLGRLNSEAELAPVVPTPSI